MKRIQCFPLFLDINHRKITVMWRYIQGNIISSNLIFQEMLVTRWLVREATLSPLKIETMTSGLITVLHALRGPGGTMTVIIPTWTASIIAVDTLHLLTEWTGITGRDITTPLNELRWNSNQSTSKQANSGCQCLYLLDSQGSFK